MRSPSIDNSTKPDQNRFAAIRQRIHSSLSSSLMLTVFTITFILVGIGTVILHEFILDRVDQVPKNTFLGIAAAYENVLHYPLMINDLNMLQDMVFDIGSNNQTNAVRIINLEGEIIASSMPDETGIVLNRNAERCQACHSPGEPQTPISEIQSYNDSDHEVFLVAHPIENRISCQNCHSEDQDNLGVILAEFSRGQFENWHALLDLGFFSGAIVFATLISTVIYTSVSRNTIKPLRQLTDRWHLESSNTGENEIELLSRQINNLNQALEKKDEELTIEQSKIDSLFSLQYDIENPPSLEQFFRQSVEIIQDITGFSTVVLRLYEPHTKSFRILAQRGMTPQMLEDLLIIPAEVGFHAEIVHTHKPVFTSDIPHDPRVSSNEPKSAGYCSLACIPLLAQDNLVGSMQLATKEEYIWEKSDYRWFSLIGQRMGSLIQQIQLSERLQDVAVVTERSRIAQEIHDGLSQLVGALRIWSEEALERLNDRELDEVQDALKKIEGVSGDVYASLREEILGLRERNLPNKNLYAYLTKSLSRFQRQWGIKVELKADRCAEDLESLPITQGAKIQLLRIFQEALTNVRRHANASLIKVNLSCADSWLVLQIVDDGTGFDPDNIPSDRFGLRIIRERVESVAGTIKITSQIGQGTQLEIKIPLQIYQDPG